jgi:hypothetical protein
VESIKPHVEHLQEAGEIETETGRYVLSAAGREALARDAEQAKSQLISGRELIRERIHEGLGYTLTDSQYDRIWNVVRDKITVAFHERGQQLVAQVSAIMAARAAAASKPDEPLFFVEPLAQAVGNTASLPAQAEELRTAIHDMFEEPFGAAFEWLSRLCAAYVALCALGFEYQSGKALARLLAKITLVLDTDIALSLLGEGEPNHSDVECLVRRWIALGGTVLISREVLHEVAHHAAIADYDFNQVRHWLPGTQEERLRLINNVFVRSFGELL